MRVHLWNPEGGVGLHEPTVRDAALATAVYLVGGDAGRALGDPVFEWVTEGRQAQNWKARQKDPNSQVPYSACGDLSHSVLYCLGVRNEKMVNRTGDGGVVPWATGANVSRLVYSMGGAWVDMVAVAGVTPMRGDVVVMHHPSKAGSEHTEVVESFNPATGEYVALAYGQADPPSFKPSAKRVHRKLTTVGPNTRWGWYRLGEGQDIAFHGFVNLMALPFEEIAWVPEGSTIGVTDDNPYPEDGSFPP